MHLRNRHNKARKGPMVADRYPSLRKRLLVEPLEDRTLLSVSYYIDGTNGDDSRTAVQAQNISTPWKTIQKGANNVVAGDTCLIRAGTYRETVAVPISGASGAPVTFRAYNNEVVTISGNNSITGWTMESAGIYYAPMSWTLGAGNQVFINGAMKPIAQWPNPGAEGEAYPWRDSSLKPSDDWAYVDNVSYDGNNHALITDAALPNIDWTGATINILSGYGWGMLSWHVTGYNDATKTLTTDYVKQNSEPNDPMAGNEYYLLGPKAAMDSSGEWYYDGANSRLYVDSASAPSGVEAKNRDYGFDISGRSYINLTNLHFLACTIKTDDGSTNSVFDGLNMQYLSHKETVDAEFGLNLRSGDVLRNSDLGFASGGLVSLAGSNIHIINSNLHDASYASSDVMVADYSADSLISHNTMCNAGRAIISLARNSVQEGAIIEYKRYPRRHEADLGWRCYLFFEYKRQLVAVQPDS